MRESELSVLPTADGLIPFTAAAPLPAGMASGLSHGSNHQGYSLHVSVSWQRRRSRSELDGMAASPSILGSTVAPPYSVTENHQASAADGG